MSEFKNDKRDGESTLFDLRGKVDVRETYRQDKREGIAEHFDSTGRVTEKIIYKNDAPIQVTYFDKTGKVIKITEGSKEA